MNAFLAVISLLFLSQAVLAEVGGFSRILVGRIPMLPVRVDHWVQPDERNLAIECPKFKLACRYFGVVDYERPSCDLICLN